MKEMSTVEMQIAERARKFPDEASTNLAQYITEAMLDESFDSLNKKSAAGVDRETWEEYNGRRKESIPQLPGAFKSGRYRAPNVRRVYIPKGDGKVRPLGLPTIEDKILQGVVTRVLTPVYEEIFYDTSYGFRPGKSQHQALEALYKEVTIKGKHYIIDADLENYFGSINHQCLREFLDKRIKDGVIRRMINKWLKAGILENGNVYYPGEGTPQGGSISPLLSNIYLHYVLDEWFHEQIQPLLKSKSFIIRYADDFLLGFINREDAIRVMRVLPKRFEKYGLKLHPEKTRLVELEDKDGQKPKTFDFLGFTHYWGKSRKGKNVLKRKTSSKKFRASLKRMDEWLRENRHRKEGEIIRGVNQMLRGHYEYYGITFNSRKIHDYYEQAKRRLHFWLNRRGGKRRWNWEKYVNLIEEWNPLLKPKIYHSSL